MKFKLAAAVLCAVGIAVPAFAGDVEDVKAVVAKAEKAFNSCDVAAIKGIQHPGVFIFSNDGTLMTQDEALASMKAQCDAGTDVQRKFTVVKVDVRGNMAVAAVTAKGTVTPKDGKAHPIQGKITVVMIKDGGAWKPLHVHGSPIMTGDGQ